MLYGFLVRSNNSWFQQIVPSEMASHLGKLGQMKTLLLGTSRRTDAVSPFSLSQQGHQLLRWRERAAQ